MVGDSICGGAGNRPALSATYKFKDATLTGYTYTSFVADDILYPYIASASNITYLNAHLVFRRST